METKETTQEVKEAIWTKPWVQSVSAIVVIFGLLGGFLFWQSTKDVVAIENSYLSAPIVNLSATTPGILNALYVKEGDKVLPNAQIAMVGSQIIYSKDGGIVSNAPELVGTYFAPGQTVVSVVNIDEMKVIGQVEETKGLTDLKIGERATFTVDAFGGKTYNGQVSEISPVSNDNGIIFSISDQRPIKKFNIKVSFDVSKYPELKSGMSAKLKVYTK